MSLPAEGPLYYEHYRDVAIGTSLLETLDELVTNKKIPAHVAAMMMHTFDKVIAEVLTSDVTEKISFKAKKLIRYTGVDEIWWFTIKDVTIHFKSPKPGNPKNLFVEKLKIIACNGNVRTTGRTDGTG